MLIKTARFNQLRDDHATLQKDYAHLEEAGAREGRAGGVAGLAGVRGLGASMADGEQTRRAHGHNAVDASAQSAGTVAVQGALIADTGLQLLRRQLLQVARSPFYSLARLGGERGRDPCHRTAYRRWHALRDGPGRT